MTLMLNTLVQDDHDTHGPTHTASPDEGALGEVILEVEHDGDPQYNHAGLLGDSTLWVLIGFLIVVGIFLWQKVPSLIGAKLASRADEISNQLDEARSLREDAQKLLADYQKRQREAEAEAQAIIEQAKDDAKNMANEARAKLDEQLARRKKSAADRIARAEAQAINEMRSKTADMAVAAAREIIAGRVDDRSQSALIDKAISDVRGRLN